MKIVRSSRASRCYDRVLHPGFCIRPNAITRDLIVAHISAQNAPNTTSDISDRSVASSHAPFATRGASASATASGTAPNTIVWL